MQESTSSLLKLAKGLAKESGKLLLKMQSKAKHKVEKLEGDFALDADYKSEIMILKRISDAYPEHSIVTEETGNYENGSEYTWVIDPLEGTLNYAHKLPLWGVNIGVMHKGRPIAGACYFPKLEEFFYGAKGKGAYMNGKKIKVNKDKELMKSFFAGKKAYFKQGMSHHLLRHLGCAALGLCYVACGRFGGVIKIRGNDPYGYVAPAVILREAGGKLTDIKGKPWNIKSKGAIASNGKLHGKLLREVKR